MNLAAVKINHSIASAALFPVVAPPSSSSSSSVSTLRKQQIPGIIATPKPKPQCLMWSQSPNPSQARRIRATACAAAATSVMPETLKSRLGNGETLYGIFLLSNSPTLAEIAGLSGYDFVVVDMEHGPGGISDALPCLRALAAANTAAILRVPETTAAWAKKALDLGPQGIMFPMIDNSEDARRAVAYCRFPPNGIRGSAHTVVRASGYGLDEGYLSNYEDELLIMCQVESAEAVANVHQIAAVDGVDCIQMGPLDLSASLGYLWDPGHKKVKEAMRAAEKAVLEGPAAADGGAYLSGFAMPHDGAVELKSRGYHMVSGAVDLGLFRNAAVEDVKRFRAAELSEGSGDEGESGGDRVDGKDEEYWSE